MNTEDLFNIYKFHNNLSIYINNKKTNFKIDYKFIQDYEYKYVLLNIYYLLEIFNIKIINDLTFCWSIKGIYSQKLKNVLSDIYDKKSLIENSINKNNKDIEPIIIKGNQILNSIKRDFEIKTNPDFINIIQLITSIHYLKNRKQNNLKEYLYTDMPHLKKYDNLFEKCIDYNSKLYI